MLRHSLCTFGASWDDKEIVEVLPGEEVSMIDKDVLRYGLTGPHEDRSK